MTTKKDLIDKIESYCEERGLSVSDVNPYLEKLYRLSKPNLEQMIPNYEERQQENDEDIDKANIIMTALFNLCIEKGFEQAKKFSYKRCAEETMKIYNTL